MWIGGAIALAILSTIPARASGVLPVTTKTIHASTSDYEITFAYPQTGVKTIDDEIATWAKGMVADFEKSAKTDRQPEDRTYTLDMSFDVARNDVSAFAVAFDEDVDTGGAHPNHDIVTFNYLMPDGWRVYLPEIFENTKGLARISELAMADLEKQLSGPDAMSDSDEIKSGAGLNWENFKDFILLRDALILRFPPYQVAAYAAGPQEVRIPLSALRDVMRVDWRTPTASFDCFRATAPVERAICSDITLSRLDRDVAQAYGDKLSYETVDANKTAIKAEQRAWLTTRNTVCKDQEGPGMVSCLTGLYRARLAALTPQP
jgi:uncharacterized protein YecT (DUF1311 family)